MHTRVAFLKQAAASDFEKVQRVALTKLSTRFDVVGIAEQKDNAAGGQPPVIAAEVMHRKEV